MKLRIAPVLKSLGVASVAFIVACGGKTENKADAEAPKADATEAAKSDAAEAPKADAAVAPQADAAPAAADAAPAAADAGAAIDVKPFEKMLGYQEALIKLVEDNKADAEKAKKEVTTWIEANKADIKATMDEMQKLGMKLQADPAQAEKVMAGFQQKAMALQEREKALETAVPGISEHISKAMAAALAPEGAVPPADPGAAPAPAPAPAPTEAPKTP